MIVMLPFIEFCGLGLGQKPDDLGFDEVASVVVFDLRALGVRLLKTVSKLVHPISRTTIRRP
jgi:hypothetical protein